MSNLKSKLSQKIESTEALSNSNTVNNTSLPYVEEGNKVILLNPNENNTVSSVVPGFAITLNEAKERISMLQSFVKEMMIPNVDYGIIPRCDKPSLFKPGAEKLCDIFGFSKQLEVINRVEDWDKGLFHYEIKVVLINKNSGLIEAEGIGCCNSRERKFKNQDSFSIINTLLKIAKKRALVDAVLSATRSSDIFTQDVEDIENNKKELINSSNNNKLMNSNNKLMNSNKKVIKPITREQQSKIFLIATQNKIPTDYVKDLMIEKYKVNESKLLTSSQADEFIDLLKCCSIV